MLNFSRALNNLVTDHQPSAASSIDIVSDYLFIFVCWTLIINIEKFIRLCLFLVYMFGALKSSWIWKICSYFYRDSYNVLTIRFFFMSKVTCSICSSYNSLICSGSDLTCFKMVCYWVKLLLDKNEVIWCGPTFTEFILSSKFRFTLHSILNYQIQIYLCNQLFLIYILKWKQFLITFMCVCANMYVYIYSFFVFMSF